MKSEFQTISIPLRIEDIRLTIAAIQRDGQRAPIVFLHGFGSTKEDYADIVRHAAFDERAFLAYDAPGCGETVCDDLSAVSISFQVLTAMALLERFDIKHFHLVGHSMGGLCALLLAHAQPHRVLSFTDIEGNISPEDCFLSRQIVEHPHDDPEAFFERFIDRTRHAPAFASGLYAASLRHKVRARAVPGIFRSMVELSDHGDLMRKFVDLPCPKMFMYGEQNAHLSYLANIERLGVRLAEIEQCGHFPMYSNPVRMWAQISDFIIQSEEGR
ncbi:alpha/beta hydrolase [Alcaligenaceae bacterium B3P038]|nr:alpha/beta hydrolase [Alcaligenaceae bacterium B3P038]